MADIIKTTAGTPTALQDLKETDYVPFIGTSKTGDIITWARIDKSTIFSLAVNPETVTNKYIDSELPQDTIKNYKPTIAQEIALIEGNKAFDFVFKMFYDLPVGTACIVPFLMCFGGSQKLAWLTEATLVLGELNSVDRKITFTLNIGGTIQRGTFVVADGVPTFTKTV